MGLDGRDEIALVHDYYRALFENSLDLIILLDIDGLIRFISSSVEKVMGYGPEEVMGTCIFQYIQFDEVKSAKTVFDRLVDDPCAKACFECHGQHKEGCWLEFEAVGESFMDHPGINGIVVNARDITGRREAERKLNRNEKRFRTIIDSISEIVLVADGEGGVKFVGESIYRVLGYTPEEAASFNLFDLVHPDDLEKVIPITLGVASEPGAAASFSYRVRHKDGGWRHLEADATNYTDDPSIDGNLYVARDVTGKVLEDERLERAVKAFINCASRELLREISTLGECSSLFRSKRAWVSEAGLESALEAMETGLKRLKRLVEGMSYVVDD